MAAGEASGSSAAVETVEAAAFPPGIKNAYLFAIFNAFSFQAVIQGPMILFAKSLGASATVLGLVTGMTPLLVTFQIPAADYVAKVGYRRFVYAGWGTRVMFIFVMALVPLGHTFLSPENQLALILILLFAFNLSRGISSAGWLPWMTALVPEPVRGRYLIRDAACVNLASFIAVAAAAVCLGANARPWKFALVLGFSAIMGAVSLTFLKRIPDVPTEPPRSGSKGRVPWLAMLRHPPFFDLVKLSVAWAIAYGGLNTFTIAFLKMEGRLPENSILFLTSVSFLGGLSSLWFLGSRLDHFGSKPILTLSLVLWLFIVAGWTLLAAKLWPLAVVLVLLLEFLMGLFAALVTTANMRLIMSVIPAMGRDHFFALFQVISSVAMGLSPIVWGLLIDALAAARPSQTWPRWNRFTIYFAAVLPFLLLTLYFVRKLVEPKAATMDAVLRHVLLHYPHRVVLRLWPR